MTAGSTAVAAPSSPLPTALSSARAHPAKTIPAARRPLPKELDSHMRRVARRPRRRERLTRWLDGQPERVCETATCARERRERLAGLLETMCPPRLARARGARCTAVQEPRQFEADQRLRKDAARCGHFRLSCSCSKCPNAAANFHMPCRRGRAKTPVCRLVDWGR